MPPVSSQNPQRRRGVTRPEAEHALRRSLDSLTLGVRRTDQANEYDRGPERMGEWEQQFQIPISGTAGDFPFWTETRVVFENPFLPGRGHRDSPYEEPTFTYGWRLLSGAPVMLSACLGKLRRKPGSITSAYIKIGWCYPGLTASGATAPVRFSGELHAVFQGWAAPGKDLRVDAED